MWHSSDINDTREDKEEVKLDVLKREHVSQVSCSDTDSHILLLTKSDQVSIVEVVEQ